MSTTINIKAYKSGNLFPESYNFLRVLPDECLNFVAHGIKHPFDLYRQSLQGIIEAYVKVLNELENLNCFPLNSDGLLVFDFENLMEAQKNLLFELLSHFDVCFNILKSIHPLAKTESEPFAEKWLKNVGHPTFLDFKEQTTVYRSYFAKIVNKMKHEGGILRPIVMLSEGRGLSVKGNKSKLVYLHENVRMAGYYLEGMQEDGAVGPHPEIHPNNTARSFNYDLKYHIANLYRVSKSLKKAIVKAVKLLYEITVLEIDKFEMAPNKEHMEDVIERVCGLPKLFYENEFKKKTPDIKFCRRDKGVELEITTPGSPASPWEGKVALCSQFQVATTLKHRLPYST